MIVVLKYCALLLSKVYLKQNPLSPCQLKLNIGEIEEKNSTKVSLKGLKLSSYLLAMFKLTLLYHQRCAGEGTSLI
jgi:hypothetical protein